MEKQRDLVLRDENRLLFGVVLTQSAEDVLLHLFVSGGWVGLNR